MLLPLLNPIKDQESHKKSSQKKTVAHHRQFVVAEYELYKHSIVESWILAEEVDKVYREHINEIEMLQVIMTWQIDQ